MDGCMCMGAWMDGWLAGEGGRHACMHAYKEGSKEGRKEGWMEYGTLCICRHILYACVNPALGARQGKAFPVTRLLGERIPKRSLSLLASFARFEGCGVRLRVSI